MVTLPIRGTVLCRAGLVAGADRQRCAGPEDQGRHLPKDGKAIKVLDASGWDYRDSRRRSRRRGAGHPQEQEPGREVRATAPPATPGAVPVGHLPRHLPLRCHYLEGIAHNARDVDFAMRWGFGWSQGPFETWQAAGWKAIAEAVRDDIAAGKAMKRYCRCRPGCSRELTRGRACRRRSYSASANTLQARSTLPVQ